MEDGTPEGSQSGWVELIGPVLTHRTAAALLGVTAPRLTAMRRDMSVFAVQDSGRAWRYPTSQFRRVDERVETLPGLVAVLTALAAPDELAAARWLGTPNRRLNARTPWETLEQDGRTDRLIEAALAQHTAWLE